jgi:hypothetical protein
VFFAIVNIGDYFTAAAFEVAELQQAAAAAIWYCNYVFYVAECVYTGGLYFT